MKPVLLMGLIAYLCLAQAFAQDDIKVTLLDVDEGQALVLSYGEEAVLIDTGHAGQVGRVLGYLAKQGVRQLRALILTHLHPDHASGYFRIREAFPQSPVLYNCHPLPKDIAPDMVRWVHEALLEDAKRQCVSAGSEIGFHQARIKIIWPASIQGTNLNHDSLVIHIESRTHNILLMGDAGIETEKRLLQTRRLPPHGAVLIVGHHGAQDATSEAFLARLRPTTAVISVNRDNIRGYPAQEVLVRLKHLGIRVLRTDLEGDIDL